MVNIGNAGKYWELVVNAGNTGK